MPYTEEDVKKLVEKHQLKLKSVKNKGVTVKRIHKQMTQMYENEPHKPKDELFNEAVSRLAPANKSKVKSVTDEPIKQVTESVKKVLEIKPKKITTKAKNIEAEKVEPVVPMKPLKKKSESLTKPNVVSEKKQNAWLEIMKKTRSEMPKGTPLKDIISKSKSQYKKE